MRLMPQNDAVMDLDALIASKNAAGRERDLAAVRSLLAIRERNEQQGHLL